MRTRSRHCDVRWKSLGRQKGVTDPISVGQRLQRCGREDTVMEVRMIILVDREVSPVIGCLAKFPTFEEG